MPQTERISLDVTTGEAPPVVVTTGASSIDVTLQEPPTVVVANREFEIQATVNLQPAPVIVERTERTIEVSVEPQPKPIVLTTGVGLPGPPGPPGQPSTVPGPQGPPGPKPTSQWGGTFFPPAIGQTSTLSLLSPAWWLAILTLGQLLGSVITGPAAIIICAFLLSHRFAKA